MINSLISQFGIFVQLFFVISGFSMCCGYYEKIKNNQISLNKFYSRRYEKILPFFTLLVLMDLAITFVLDGGLIIENLYEAFADLTLMFGFYTINGLSVIGVGWTLGVIFGFYILFPFFVYLIWNKKRAWFSLLLTIAISVLCNIYFGTGRKLTFPWLCYFVAGGLIYLYRDEIRRVLNNAVIGILVTLIGFAITFFIRIPILGDIGTLLSTVRIVIGFSLMLSGALCRDAKLWCNPITKFVSGVSLEIYIAHMMVFRVLEKIGLTTIAGENVVSYIIACVGTIGGALVFAATYQYIEAKIKKKVVKA